MYCCIDCPRLHHAVNLVFVIVTIITYPHNRILERGYPGSSTSNCCPAALALHVSTASAKDALQRTSKEAHHCV